MTHMSALQEERRLARLKLNEIRATYIELSSLCSQWEKHKPGSDDYEELAGEMTATALVLASKLQSLDDIFDATPDDDTERMFQRLEEARGRLGAKGTPLSVAAFLNLIGKTLHKEYSELPVQATYFRWLKETKDGGLRISATHQDLFRKFLDALEGVEIGPSKRRVSRSGVRT